MLLALALGVLVSLPVVRWILHPVRRLDEGTGRVASAVLAGGAAEPVADDSGPPELRRLSVSFDRMAETVTGALAAQRAFVADASHQLRNPLTALRLRLSNLQGHVDSAAVDDHGAALEEAERLSELLDGLLALARTERTAPLVEVDVDAAVGDRVEAWRPLAEHTGLRLELDGQPGLTVSAPVGAVETVLDAVLDNAVKFSSAGDAITVHTARHDGRVEISVRDTGPGLGPDELERATDRFWRSPSQSNVDGLGAGPGDRGADRRAVRRVAAPGVARGRRVAGGGAAAGGIGRRRDGAAGVGVTHAAGGSGVCGTAARRPAVSTAATAATVAAPRSASAASVVASGASSGCARSACQAQQHDQPGPGRRGDPDEPDARPVGEPAGRDERGGEQRQPLRACMPTKCAIRRSPPVVLQPRSGSPGPPSGTPTEWPLAAIMTKPSSRPRRVTASPSRTAVVATRSRPGSRRNRRATASVANHSTTIDVPITPNSTLPIPPSALKWL